jgi:tRNA(Ile)-lysidine synthase
MTVRRLTMQPISENEAEALFADLGCCGALVLAVSGGPDSTALLYLAARWRGARKDRPRLLAVTVDHGLRPESAKEARAVKRLAKKLGVEHETVRWTGPKPATGIQEKARAERYRLLAAAARKLGASHILTAHTLDDQAETVLIRLARGSGLTGLAGMARLTPLGPLTLARPLLTVPKARLIATLDAAGIAYTEDPSNLDPRFTRVRLRRLMPALAKEGLDARRLALLARRLARAEAALEAAAGTALKRLALPQEPDAARLAFDARGFAELPAEIGLRLLGRGIGRVGNEGPVELAKLEALFDALVHWREGGESGCFRRTLAGALLTADAKRLIIERAPARRRPRSKARSAAVNQALAADSPPHSLGNH